MDNEDRAIVICRICRSSNLIYLCETYNEHSKTTKINHYRCNECGSVFVGNDIDSEELSVAYSTLDFKQYYDEIEESAQRGKMATAITNLNQLISRSDNIIDIGTGNGLFVKLLAQSGFENVSAHEIQGSDLSEIEQIANHLYQDFDYSSIPSHNFDAVTLLDVVEHVINPRYLISTCHRILKNRGVIYFHTPIVTKTDRFMHLLQKIPLLKQVGSMWQRGRTSIFHLENYTSKSLTFLLDKNGFEDIKIEIKNELSWPVTKYIKVYLLKKLGLPDFLAPIFLPVFYPLLATDFFNANKAIVTAVKAENFTQKN